MTLSKQLQIFLLYARADQEAVLPLYRRLAKEGANVWLDQEKIFPGQDWEHEIHAAIDHSDMVIVCLSRKFNRQGGYRHEELRAVLKKAGSLPEGGIFIVPARLEKCNMPAPLRRWQRVDLYESDGYERLLNALKQYITLL